MQRYYLPIAERELRAASRRRGTFRLRWVVALVGILASFIWYKRLPTTSVAATLVDSLFSIQTLCAFGFALLAGPFLTADCLSEERRDGTLHLLFLTKLRATGIVWGKFTGTAAIALYILLALVPITAVPLLLGGTTFLEFCRTALALLNTLFFSLAIGLVVSAFTTHYSRALSLTIFFLALFTAVFPVIGMAGALWKASPTWSALAWLSPFTSFRAARELAYVPAPASFWLSMLVTHVFAWAFLAIASLYLARSWQDRPELQPTVSDSGLKRRQRRSRVVNSRRQARDEPFDPLVRLLGKTPWFRTTVWLVAAAWVGLVIANRYSHVWGFDDVSAAKLFSFLFKTLIAFQACRFFVETRRSGALELLFCTPVRNADLIRVQWRALLRIFLLPCAIFLALAWMNVAYPPAHSAAMTASRGSMEALSGSKPGYLTTLFVAIGLCADVLALGWVGMYMGLTTKKPALAPALTIILVLILPALLYYFDLVADMLFVSWATTRFREEFRWQASIPIRLSPMAG